MEQEISSEPHSLDYTSTMLEEKNEGQTPDVADETSKDFPTTPANKGQMSPLTGAYLLIILSEPYSNEHQEKIVQRLTKGLLSWDKNSSYVDLNCELLNFSNTPPEPDVSKTGEKLVQWASENLVVEVLYHSQANTLIQCMKNLLASFTRYRHIIHAGYSYQGTGSWLLQDGTFSIADFIELWDEPEVYRLLPAYKGDIMVSLHTTTDNSWSESKFKKESFTKLCQVRINESEGCKEMSEKHNAGITSFVDFLQSQLMTPSPLNEILQPSDIVGNIRFSHPTLYVFPGGQGDAALFGVNGFNMLIDGGYSRKACFWDFIRHLDRLDAVLLTRINNSNMGGLGSLMERKSDGNVFPQIGHFFGNLITESKEKDDSPSSDTDELVLNLAQQSYNMYNNLRGMSLKPQFCSTSRESLLEPINLYHKVGHGKLDMYVLNPSKDSKELREFLNKWKQNDNNLACVKVGESSGISVQYPILNLVSICALLVWQPTNPNQRITRILFPGSTPQSKILDGLNKLKHLEFLKYPVCTGKTILASSSSTVKSEKVITEVKQKLKSKDGKYSVTTIESKVIRSSSSSAKDSKASQNKLEKQQLEKSDTISTIGGTEQGIEEKEPGKVKKISHTPRKTETTRTVAKVISTKTTSTIDNKVKESTKVPSKLLASNRSAEETTGKSSPKVSSSKETKTTVPVAKKLEKVSPTSPKKDVNGTSQGASRSSSKYGIGQISKTTTITTTSSPKQSKDATNISRKVVESKTRATPITKIMDKTQPIRIPTKTPIAAKTTTRPSTAKPSKRTPVTAERKKGGSIEPKKIINPSAIVVTAITPSPLDETISKSESEIIKSEQDSDMEKKILIETNGTMKSSSDEIERQILSNEPVIKKENGILMSSNVTTTESGSELSSLEPISITEDQETQSLGDERPPSSIDPRDQDYNTESSTAAYTPTTDNDYTPKAERIEVISYSVEAEEEDEYLVVEKSIDDSESVDQEASRDITDLEKLSMPQDTNVIEQGQEQETQQLNETNIIRESHKLDLENTFSKPDAAATVETDIIPSSTDQNREGESNFSVEDTGNDDDDQNLEEDSLELLKPDQKLENEIRDEMSASTDVESISTPHEIEPIKSHLYSDLEQKQINELGLELEKEIEIEKEEPRKLSEDSLDKVSRESEVTTKLEEKEVDGLVIGVKPHIEKTDEGKAFPLATPPTEIESGGETSELENQDRKKEQLNEYFITDSEKSESTVTVSKELSYDDEPISTSGTVVPEAEMLRSSSMGSVETGFSEELPLEISETSTIHTSDSFITKEMESNIELPSKVAHESEISGNVQTIKVSESVEDQRNGEQLMSEEKQDTLNNEPEPLSIDGKEKVQEEVVIKKTETSLVNLSKPGETEKTSQENVTSVTSTEGLQPSKKDDLEPVIEEIAKVRKYSLTYDEGESEEMSKMGQTVLEEPQVEPCKKEEDKQVNLKAEAGSQKQSEVQKFEQTESDVQSEFVEVYGEQNIKTPETKELGTIQRITGKTVDEIETGAESIQIVRDDQKILTTNNITHEERAQLKENTFPDDGKAESEVNLSPISSHIPSPSESQKISDINEEKTSDSTHEIPEISANVTEQITEENVSKPNEPGQLAGDISIETTKSVSSETLATEVKLRSAIPSTIESEKLPDTSVEKTVGETTHEMPDSSAYVTDQILENDASKLDEAGELTAEICSETTKTTVSSTTPQTEVLPSTSKISSTSEKLSDISVDKIEEDSTRKLPESSVTVTKLMTEDHISKPHEPQGLAGEIDIGTTKKIVSSEALETEVELPTISSQIPSISDTEKLSEIGEQNVAGAKQEIPESSVYVTEKIMEDDVAETNESRELVGEIHTETTKSMISSETLETEVILQSSTSQISPSIADEKLSEINVEEVVGQSTPELPESSVKVTEQIVEENVPKPNEVGESFETTKKTVSATILETEVKLPSINSQSSPIAVDEKISDIKVEEVVGQSTPELPESSVKVTEQIVEDNAPKPNEVVESVETIVSSTILETEVKLPSGTSQISPPTADKKLSDINLEALAGQSTAEFPESSVKVTEQIMEDNVPKPIEVGKSTATTKTAVSSTSLETEVKLSSATSQISSTTPSEKLSDMKVEETIDERTPEIPESTVKVPEDVMEVNVPKTDEAEKICTEASKTKDSSSLETEVKLPSSSSHIPSVSESQKSSDTNEENICTSIQGMAESSTNVTEYKGKKVLTQTNESEELPGEIDIETTKTTVPSATSEKTLSDLPDSSANVIKDIIEDDLSKPLPGEICIETTKSTVSTALESKEEVQAAQINKSLVKETDSASVKAQTLPQTQLYQHIRTPDEVAELPLHEVIESSHTRRYSTDDEDTTHTTTLDEGIENASFKPLQFETSHPITETTGDLAGSGIEKKKVEDIQETTIVEKVYKESKVEISSEKIESEPIDTKPIVSSKEVEEDLQPSEEKDQLQFKAEHKDLTSTPIESAKPSESDKTCKEFTESRTEESYTIDSALGSASVDLTQLQSTVQENTESGTEITPLATPERIGNVTLESIEIAHEIIGSQAEPEPQKALKTEVMSDKTKDEVEKVQEKAGAEKQPPSEIKIPTQSSHELMLKHLDKDDTEDLLNVIEEENESSLSPKQSKSSITSTPVSVITSVVITPSTPPVELEEGDKRGSLFFEVSEKDAKVEGISDIIVEDTAKTENGIKDSSSSKFSEAKEGGEKGTSVIVTPADKMDKSDSKETRFDCKESEKKSSHISAFSKDEVGIDEKLSPTIIGDSIDTKTAKSDDNFNLEGDKKTSGSSGDSSMSSSMTTIIAQESAISKRGEGEEKFSTLTETTNQQFNVPEDHSQLTQVSKTETKKEEKKIFYVGDETDEPTYITGYEDNTKSDDEIYEDDSLMPSGTTVRSGLFTAVTTASATVMRQSPENYAENVENIIHTTSQSSREMSPELMKPHDDSLKDTPKTQPISSKDISGEPKFEKESAGIVQSEPQIERESSQAVGQPKQDMKSESSQVSEPLFEKTTVIHMDPSTGDSTALKTSDHALKLSAEELAAVALSFEGTSPTPKSPPKGEQFEALSEQTVIEPILEKTYLERDKDVTTVLTKKDEILSKAELASTSEIGSITSNNVHREGPFHEIEKNIEEFVVKEKTNISTDIAAKITTKTEASTDSVNITSLNLSSNLPPAHISEATEINVNLSSEPRISSLVESKTFTRSGNGIKGETVQAFSGVIVAELSTSNEIYDSIKEIPSSLTSTEEKDVYSFSSSSSYTLEEASTQKKESESFTTTAPTVEESQKGMQSETSYYQTESTSYLKEQSSQPKISEETEKESHFKKSEYQTESMSFPKVTIQEKSFETTKSSDMGTEKSQSETKESIHHYSPADIRQSLEEFTSDIVLKATELIADQSTSSSSELTKSIVTNQKQEMFEEQKKLVKDDHEFSQKEKGHIEMESRTFVTSTEQNRNVLTSSVDSHTFTTSQEAGILSKMTTVAGDKHQITPDPNSGYSLGGDSDVTVPLPYTIERKHPVSSESSESKESGKSTKLEGRTDDKFEASKHDSPSKVAEVVPAAASISVGRRFSTQDEFPEAKYSAVHRRSSELIGSTSALQKQPVSGQFSLDHGSTDTSLRRLSGMDEPEFYSSYHEHETMIYPGESSTTSISSERHTTQSVDPATTGKSHLVYEFSAVSPQEYGITTSSQCIQSTYDPDEEGACSSGDFSDSQFSSVTQHFKGIDNIAYRSESQDLGGDEYIGSSKMDTENGNIQVTAVAMNNGNTVQSTSIVETASVTQTATTSSSSLASSSKEDEDIIKKWGQPLGLPGINPDDINLAQVPSSEGRATPKGKTGSLQSISNKRTPGHLKTKSMKPTYVDLAYVPHHGNSNYSDSEFFRLIRSRYYVFSGLEPSREVFEGLLQGKKEWEDKNLDVTIIPTYDTDTLSYWVADSEAALGEARIDLAPSASRCTINLQDHETSCSAYRLEF